MRHHKSFGLVLVVVTLVSLAAAGTVLAMSAPGQGSGISGRDSAGGPVTFGFNNVSHQIYSIGDEFNCGGKGKPFKYEFSTLTYPPVGHPNDTLRLSRLGHRFRLHFVDKYTSVSTFSHPRFKTYGKASIRFTGVIRQIRGKAGGPGRVKASGTIAIHVSKSCRTGTLKWSGRGQLVAP